MKKIYFILLLALISILAISICFAEDDSYSCDYSFLDLDVESNGIVHVHESYNFSFIGQYNGVYRDIPLMENQSVKDISITTNDAYYTVKKTQDKDENIIHLRIYLYNDKAHTQKISNRNVEVNISYDIENAIVVYDDLAVLQYKLWGEEWDFDLSELATTVTLPTDNYSYMIYPKEFSWYNESEGNVIYSLSDIIYSGNFLELQVLMSSDVFSNAEYVVHEEGNVEENAIKPIILYEFLRAAFSVLSVIIFVFSIINPIILLITYFKYGREPKVEYDAIYEREFPTDDPPVFVNAVYGTDFMLGEADINGFEATILDLINRNYLELKVVKKERQDDIYLKFYKFKLKELEKYERAAIKCLFEFSENNELYLNNFAENFDDEKTCERFSELYSDWQKKVHNRFFGNDELSRYFDNRGSKIGYLIYFLTGIFGIICIITFFRHPFSFVMPFICFGGILLIIEFIISSFIKDDILGHWTKEGRLNYLKWSNFKKFLKDFSLMNEYPPQSIVIWEKYLIYATALGIADTVRENLNLYHFDNESNLMLLNNIAGLVILSEALNIAYYSGVDLGLLDLVSVAGGGGGGAF